MKDLKLEVGMYVRTDFGIGKIKDIFGTNIEVDFKALEFTTKFGYYVKSRHIEKSSHNIIDLIEVGDYVNGARVIENLLDCIYIQHNPPFCYVEGYWENDINEPIKPQEIKSIVTKEQFANMQYVIKGDKANVED